MKYVKLIRKREKDNENTGAPDVPTADSLRPICSISTLANALIENFAQTRPVEMLPIGSSGSMFYIPRYMDPASQNCLLECINHEGSSSPGIWKELKSRRLQCWGLPAPGQDLDTSGSIFPSWLQTIADDLVFHGIFNVPENEPAPSQVLINDYSPFEGILHHCDGNAYYDKVAILSLGSTRLMTFRPKLSSEEIGVKDGGDVFSVVLEPGSLFVFSREMFSDMLHGIVSDNSDDDDSDMSCGGGCFQEIRADEVPCINHHLCDTTNSNSNGNVSSSGTMHRIEWKARTSLTFRCVLK